MPVLALEHVLEGDEDYAQRDQGLDERRIDSNHANRGQRNGYSVRNSEGGNLKKQWFPFSGEP